MLKLSHPPYKAPRVFNYLISFSAVLLLTMGATAEEDEIKKLNYIPYAKDAKNKLESGFSLGLNTIRKHVKETLDLKGDEKSVPDKDSAAKSHFLGYPSPEVEVVEFNGNLDPNKGISSVGARRRGFLVFMILVDDKATLTIKTKGKEHTLSVNGSALWRSKSYREFFKKIIPVTGETGETGEKFDLKLRYENTANLTTHYQKEDKTKGLQDFDGVSIYVMFIPFEFAPKVLAVNSDFDEGRIDAKTGYALPDCDDVVGINKGNGHGNKKPSLLSVRDHLDGLYKKGDFITDDMHRGWFGVLPRSFDDEFWKGAKVTISKIKKIDPISGLNENGQVRFYAKWVGVKGVQVKSISPYNLRDLEAFNLVEGGASGTNVYGVLSKIPHNAEFWMEGVRPGKITLEWRIKKGTFDIRHRQTFLVCTQKTQKEWYDEVLYQIRLQTKVKGGKEVNILNYDPGDGFKQIDPKLGNQNVPMILAIYYYYQQLFKQYPDQLMWAGMAKTAAAPIYAAMSDLSLYWSITKAKDPPEFVGDVNIKVLIEGLLLGGQKKIFEDLAWAHRAYIASGIWSLNFVADSTIADEPNTDLEAWKKLDEGIRTSKQLLINLGNAELLRREQEIVIQESYTAFASNLWMKQPPLQSWIGGVNVTENKAGYANVGEWLSANSNKNPIPGGPKFRDVVPKGRIDIFKDRWQWTSNSKNGMVEIWIGSATSLIIPKYNPTKRLFENNKSMLIAAGFYSLARTELPQE